MYKNYQSRQKSCNGISREDGVFLSLADNILLAVKIPLGNRKNKQSWK